MILVLWPYLLAAGAVAFWMVTLRRQLDEKLAFAVTAWTVCVIAVLGVALACGYLVPLDVAGTPPPDPRNARLRFLITAAFQVPAALIVAYFASLPFRIRGRAVGDRAN